MYGILPHNGVCVVNDVHDDDDDDDDDDVAAAAADDDDGDEAAPVECGANKDNTVFTIHNGSRVNLGS